MSVFVAPLNIYRIKWLRFPVIRNAATSAATVIAFVSLHPLCSHQLKLKARLLIGASKIVLEFCVRTLSSNALLRLRATVKESERQLFIYAEFVFTSGLPFPFPFPPPIVVARCAGFRRFFASLL